MSIYSLIKSCENVFYSLYDISQPVLDTLRGGYVISGTFYSLFDILFGVGLPVFLGVCVIKWVL